ncbi:MAG: PilZ domain-containing protein [Nitrospirota bacterium]|nr:PilZ domain-containing protein [Nitrospirota bacterium]MDH5768294.1 PilZ domain-containing protein [Nitrospirota bacterium]
MKKVIIAEDIYANLEREQSFLNRSVIKIFTAATNEKTLALHRAEKADLIIAKLDTPEMSGEILSSLIRDDNELCKVSLIIIGSHTESDFERCLQCKANAFISSPVNNAVLLQESYQLLHIAQRRSYRVPVSMTIHGASKKKPFTGYIENISISGMLFRLDAILYESDTIKCSFSLPDSTHITTNAEIVRVLEKETKHDTNRYGVKFIDLSTHFTSAIEAFVEKQYQHT